MTDNVIPIGGIEFQDVEPDLILENSKGEFEAVVVLGFDREGNTCYLSSINDGADILWLLEKCKKFLLMDPEEFE